jgi:hypothetical protein
MVSYVVTMQLLPYPLGIPRGQESDLPLAFTQGTLKSLLTLVPSLRSAIN